MKRLILLALLGLALAQNTGTRVIEIEYPDGTRSGNLRNGPWTFQSNKPGGVIGKVKDLQINSSKATLVAPDGKTMDAAKGERTATFEGQTTVKRDRMTANGPKLVYSEKTGLGTLEGPAQMRQEPKERGGDPVEVAASRMTFDVDTDVSTSEGQVSLKNGRQEGKSDTVYYEEKKALAVFNDNEQVILTRKRDSGDLVIRGKEVRSLTDQKRLIATGGVTLVDGDLTTTGDSLFFDDNKGEAIIIGRPARTVNTKDNSSFTSGRIQGNVNRRQYRPLQTQFQLPVQDFRKLDGK